MTTDISLENYYYDNQLRNHMVQFMAIFSGLQVSVGKNDFGSQTNLISVPIMYGSRDRVVSHIMSNQTQNKMLRLPTMSAQLMGMELHVERLSGQNTERKEIKLKRGGVIPDDLQQHSMLKPIPYKITMELGLNVSNTDHHFQLLEQILLLFNPSLQIQVSDAYGNQASVIEVFLESINLDEDYPAGAEVRIVSSSLVFSYTLYLSAPVNLRDEIIKSIKVRVAASTESGLTPASINDGIIDPFIITADNWEDNS
jgi:hypothetical protein